jgi:hypothetical protein
MIKIYLDDCRPAPPGWLLVKDALSCFILLEWNKGRVSALSLDHDLQSMDLPEKHGAWLTNQMIQFGLYADIIYMHTSNPVGRQNMFNDLSSGIRNGLIPDHVKINYGPMPGYNLVTGEWLDN